VETNFSPIRKYSIYLSKPISNNYCGFQFGVWAGQLGDGRAHTLGQIIHDKKIF